MFIYLQPTCKVGGGGGAGYTWGFGSDLALEDKRRAKGLDTRQTIGENHPLTGWHLIPLFALLLIADTTDK